MEEYKGKLYLKQEESSRFIKDNNPFVLESKDIEKIVIEEDFKENNIFESSTLYGVVDTHKGRFKYSLTVKIWNRRTLPIIPSTSFTIYGTRRTDKRKLEKIRKDLSKIYKSDKDVVVDISEFMNRDLVRGYLVLGSPIQSDNVRLNLEAM